MWHDANLQQSGQHLTHVMMQAAVETVFGQPRGPLAWWLSQKPIQDHITRLFRNFLLHKRDSEGNLLYEERIRNMCIGTVYIYCLHLRNGFLSVT